MEMSEILTILIAICPTISAVITVIGGAVGVIKAIKTVTIKNQDELTKAYARIAKLESKLNVATTKISSIEKMLIEEREKH